MIARTKQPEQSKNLGPVHFWVQGKFEVGEGYLKQLTRLLRLYLDHKEEINDEGVRLLTHATFSYFLECLDNGTEEEALEALRRYRTGFRYNKKARSQ